MARAIWTFEVYPDDGEMFMVEAVSRDVVLWEKASKHTLKYLFDTMDMGQLTRVAYFAAKRLELFDGQLKDWTETVDISLHRPPGKDDDDGDEVEPTEPDL